MAANLEDWAPSRVAPLRRLLALAFLVLLASPWFDARPPVTGGFFAAWCARASLATAGVVFEKDAVAFSRPDVLFARETLAAFVLMIGGAAAALVAPRRRWPLVPFVAATLALAGIGSLFAGWLGYEESLLFTPDHGTRMLVSHACGAIPLAIGLAAVVLVLKGRDTGVLVVYALAFLTTPAALPIFRDCLWGLHAACACLAALAVLEARRHDEVVVWLEKLEVFEAR